jgi:hypothetical protein
VLVALERFVAEGDEVRAARWTVPLRAIMDGLPGLPLRLVEGVVPRLCLEVGSVERARAIERALRARRPQVFLEPGELELGRIWVSPLCLRPEDPALIVQAMQEVW